MMAASGPDDVEGVPGVGAAAIGQASFGVCQYDDKIDSGNLYQGDIVESSGEVFGLVKNALRDLAKYDAESVRAFMIITQSCDLVVRDNHRRNTTHVALAPVTTLKDAVCDMVVPMLYRRVGRYVSEDDRNGYNTQLNRILNNSNDNCFFLFGDQANGLGGHSCARLRVHLPLAEPNACEVLLRHKRGQLSGVFRAKLGSMLGSIYSRVGTPDFESFGQAGKEDRARVVSSLSGLIDWVKPDEFKCWSQGLTNDGDEQKRQSEFEDARRMKKVPSKRDTLCAQIEACIKEVRPDVLTPDIVGQLMQRIKQAKLG